MNKNIYNILITGAGQLGSRYLQGLVKCEIPLKIFVFDISSYSLETAKNRWIEANGLNSSHEVIYLNSFEYIPENLDLVIVSTTSSNRLDAILNISKLSNVKYWVLEKVLAQSLVDLEKISKLLGAKKNAWVNTPRRMMPWYKEIKSTFETFSPIQMKIIGMNWGLTCNSLHFIDLFSWITGEELVSINTNNLDQDWFESKRKGYWEVNGELIGEFSNGSKLFLNSNVIEMETEILIQESQYWKISEKNGIAERNDGYVIKGNLFLQSELTSILVESILLKGYCDLPDLEESLKQHRVFIKAIVSHWNMIMKTDNNLVPIT